MKTQKTIFVAAFACVAAVFALFEYGIVPSALIGNGAETNYIIDLVAVVSAFAGCFGLLYCFRMPHVRRIIEHPDERYAERYYKRVTTARIMTWMALTLLNIVLYYEAPYASNPKYCILVLFIAGIFCWPGDRGK